MRTCEKTEEEGDGGRLGKWINKYPTEFNIIKHVVRIKEGQHVNT